MWPEHNNKINKEAVCYTPTCEWPAAIFSQASVPQPAPIITGVKCTIEHPRMIREKLFQLKEKLSEIGDDSAGDLIDDALANSSSLDEFLVSNDLWGGSGSLADQAGIGDGIRTDQRRKIESLLIDIGEEQIKMNKANVRTGHWVHVFKSWRESGI